MLMNYVALAPGVPTRMHFTDWYEVKREIMDNESGRTKVVNSLVFQVDELDGEDAARTFSILSKKLAAHFKPFVDNRTFKNYDFIITQMGDGFYKDWTVQPIERVT